MVVVGVRVVPSQLEIAPALLLVVIIVIDLVVYNDRSGSGRSGSPLRAASTARRS